jgi:hypothetical protein
VPAIDGFREGLNPSYGAYTLIDGFREGLNPSYGGGFLIYEGKSSCARSND